MSGYIDGDALFSEVTNSYRWATGEARKAYRNVLDMICNADSKDVVEVRHGKWLCDEMHIDGITSSTWNKWYCSECKTMVRSGWSTSADGFKPLYKRCPECGAKMDKEKEK